MPYSHPYIKRIIAARDVAVAECSDGAMSRVTGRKYENELLFIIDVKDGKIQAVHEYLDTLSSARASGRVPYPQ